MEMPGVQLKAAAVELDEYKDKRKVRAMADVWFYALNGVRSDAVDFPAIQALAAQGALPPTALVWKEGMPQWVTAGSVQGLTFRTQPLHAPAAGTAVPPPQPPQKGVFGQLGQRLSDAAGLPTIGDVPVKEILTDGLTAGKNKDQDIEETFAVGTASNTPPLSEIQTGWPRPTICWRVLFFSLAAYFVMRIGITEYQNTNCIPGMMMLGAFAVPFAVVIFFFELNTPRNVSIYQIGKLLILGGGMGILGTLLIGRLIPGSGVGTLVPALLTGLIEETGKALALWLIAREVRYRWQLNGVVFGAAIGAGFAGFETAGYAFGAMINNESVVAAFQSLSTRGFLAPGGHVIWTAMIGSALWKAKGQKPFELSMLSNPIVIRRFVVAVVLHGLWDMNIFPAYDAQYIVLTLVGWYLIFAILKDGYKEIVEAKRAAGLVV